METLLNAQTLQKIEQAYDSPPWWYDLRGFFILTFSYRSTLGRQVRFFGRNVSLNHLEGAIGSGTFFGLVMRWRAWKGLSTAKVTGFDYAEPMLAGARKRFAGHSGFQMLRADVAQLDFPDESFDSANVANAVHCFPEVDAGLRELGRVLKPGATLAMNVLLYPKGWGPLRWIANRIADWGMKKGILETPYTKEDIMNRIETAGLEILEAQESGNALMVVARKPLAEKMTAPGRLRNPQGREFPATYQNRIAATAPRSSQRFENGAKWRQAFWIPILLPLSILWILQHEFRAFRARR